MKNRVKIFPPFSFCAQLAFVPILQPLLFSPVSIPAQFLSSSSPSPLSSPYKVTELHSIQIFFFLLLLPLCILSRAFLVEEERLERKESEKYLLSDHLRKAEFRASIFHPPLSVRSVFCYFLPPTYRAKENFPQKNKK